MQKYHDEPKQYKGYLKSALAQAVNEDRCYTEILQHAYERAMRGVSRLAK